MTDIQVFILAVCLSVLTLALLSTLIYVVLTQNSKQKELFELFTDAQQKLVDRSMLTLKATSAIDAANAEKIKLQTDVEVEALKEAFQADLRRNEAYQKKLEIERKRENTVYDVQGRAFSYDELEPVSSLEE